jgi:hypothetical protein
MLPPLPLQPTRQGGARRRLRHPGGVGEHVGYGDGLLAVGGELGPVLGDRGGVGEQAPLGKHVHEGRDRPCHSA